MHDWTPKRNGSIYCAPACGGKCTWGAFRRATRDAQLLTILLGTGWEPHVWENLGWHYSAQDKSHCLIVSPNIRTVSRKQVMKRMGVDIRYDRFIPVLEGYTAYLNEPDAGGGRWVGKGITPKEAVTDVMQKAKAELEGIKKLVECVERAA